MCKTTPKLKTGYALPHDPNVGAVIVGFDRFINYYKIQYAQLCINENPGCKFIATNLDAVTHLTDAQEWAGNGAMTGAIKGCTGQEPVVVGKPAPLMIDYLSEKYGVERNRVCMVGDRLDTDIVFGNSNGALCCLVFSGVTTEEKYTSADNKIKANYYCNSIADFFD
jgi:4-nitrophenyl phosphatase/phosphoglycolate phosphatase